jgi:hypothetical protein
VALAVLVAIAVALAVPGARSAILHALHLEGATIERVDVLPPAQERPLGAALGAPITHEAAEIVLGRPFALPPTTAPPRLRIQSGRVISTLLADPDPVLLTELRNEVGDVILKKIVGNSTGVEPVTVHGAPGFWIAGAPHVFVSPEAPPRLAGQVLVWSAGGLLYRLEGRGLTKEHALRLAREIAGT